MTSAGANDTLARPPVDRGESLRFAHVLAGLRIMRGWDAAEPTAPEMWITQAPILKLNEIEQNSFALILYFQRERW